jgi:hypothetical protein
MLLRDLPLLLLAYFIRFTYYKEQYSYLREHLSQGKMISGIDDLELLSER